MSDTHPTTYSHRPVACATLALGGLLLTAACGTVHAGAAHNAVGPSASVIATPRPAAPTPAAPSLAPSSGSPAGAASRVRKPLALPVTAVSTGGAITGTVSSGMLDCLVVRTDAGQLFNVVGGPTARLRQLLPAAAPATTPAGGLSTRGVGGGVSGLSGSLPSLRISAAGTLRAAPSFCGASYTFTIATVRVESLPLR